MKVDMSAALRDLSSEESHRINALADHCQGSGKSRQVSLEKAMLLAEELRQRGAVVTT
jgi:hypothetical protein